jgi:hypothetical protein
MTFWRKWNAREFFTYTPAPQDLLKEVPLVWREMIIDGNW